MSTNPTPSVVRQRRRRWPLVLLLIPFFIWYQFLWVVLGVVCTALVYALYRSGEEPEGRP